MNDLIGKLQAIRLAQGRTQLQIALVLGVTKQAVGTWERHEREPSLEMLGRWAAIFGATVDIVVPGVPPAPVDEIAVLASELDETERRIVLLQMRALAMSKRQAS